MQNLPSPNIRWKFTTGMSETEYNARQAVSKKIDEWWKLFQENTQNLDDRFSNRNDFDIVGFMHAGLEPIHSSLMWEFGPAVKTKGHRLVITPESRKDLRPLVDEILRKAPVIEGWEFYSYRLAEDFDNAKITVEARTRMPVSELSFFGKKNEFNQMDLTFIAPQADSEEKLNKAYQQAFILIETMLGEEVLDKWIGALEIDSKFPLDEKAQPISELGSWWKTSFQLLQDSLPDKPFYKRMNEAKWTLFEMKPPEKEEYPQQKDMFVGRSMCKPLWQNAHSRYGFASERFSKLGEVFCYLKLDGRDGLDEEHFEDRGDIEDALDDGLLKAEAGCVMGGGTGLHYSYIDLALVDVEKGLDIIKDVLRKGNITKKAWILFFASELASEWVGIWDDSPVPPMPDFESK